MSGVGVGGYRYPPVFGLCCEGGECEGGEYGGRECEGGECGGGEL